jgi:asparagine synthase (glutamine-hydrolysing)
VLLRERMETPAEPPTAAASVALGVLLRRAVERPLVGHSAASLLYSGGLDSSVIAAARPRNIDLQLVTIGTPDSPDLEAARSGAGLLGLPIETRIVQEGDVRSAMSRWANDLTDLREPQRSVFVATALAVAAARTRLVLCGQGADEQFHGYAHFAGLSPEEAGARAQADLRRLTFVDWPKAQHVARELGHELSAPFLDPELIAWTRSLPPEMHRAADGRKPMLRAAAGQLGVPAELVARPKRALQYGSGVHRMVRRIDREHEATRSATNE